MNKANTPSIVTGSDERAREVLREIVAKFEADEAQGYRSSTRTYVLEMARAALAASRPPDAGAVPAGYIRRNYKRGFESYNRDYIELSAEHVAAGWEQIPLFEAAALATPKPPVDEPWPGYTADQDKRRVVTLAKLGLMLSVMADGEAPEVTGFDAADLYGEVLMALAIEDAEDEDIALQDARDDPEGHMLTSVSKPPVDEAMRGVLAEAVRGFEVVQAETQTDTLRRWAERHAGKLRYAIHNLTSEGAGA